MRGLYNAMVRGINKSTRKAGKARCNTTGIVTADRLAHDH